jgi:RNA polymerase sigma-70 factor (ECF subfamily)
MRMTPWAALSDEQLIELVGEGHKEPLGELYIRHSAMVKDAIMRICPEVSIALAEEMVQEVFLILNRKAQDYEEQLKFKGWLFGIAMRTVFSWRRTHWMHRRLLLKNGSKFVGVAMKASGHARNLEIRDTLTQGLEKLSPVQREALFLHAVEGFTGDEIAQILNVKPKTVWTRLHRARLKMLEALAPDAAELVFCRGEA